MEQQQSITGAWIKAKQDFEVEWHTLNRKKSLKFKLVAGEFYPVYSVLSTLSGFPPSVLINFEDEVILTIPLLDTYFEYNINLWRESNSLGINLPHPGITETRVAVERELSPV